MSLRVHMFDYLFNYAFLLFGNIQELINDDFLMVLDKSTLTNMPASV